MISLPGDARFDSWRNCGADIPQATAEALATPALPPGQTVIDAPTTLPAIVRGTLDASGKRLTSFYFPKSCYALYGVGTAGPSGSPGWSWDGTILQFAPMSRTIFMDVEFVCPDVATPPHHYERGYNPINTRRVPDSQLILINCGFYNCDSALVLGGSHSHAYHITVGIRGTHRTGLIGHYGVRVSGVDNALEGLRVPKMFYHDMSTEMTKHCVFKDVSGYDLNKDFHAWSLDEHDDNNLYININHGKTTRPFLSGGSIENKPWSGLTPTFYQMLKGDGTALPLSAYPDWLHPVIIS